MALGTGDRDLAVASRQGTQEFCARGTPSPPLPLGPLPPLPHAFLAVRLGLSGEGGQDLGLLGVGWGGGGSWLVHAQRCSL